jgi:hypothetical protein
MTGPCDSRTNSDISRERLSQEIQAGLCGGSYYKREAILDALSDERMAQLDWTLGDGPGDGVTEVPNVAIVALYFIIHGFINNKKK